MMTYEKIVGALLSGEAGMHIPTGVFLSHPVPRKDPNGNLVDNFFLYSMNRATKRPDLPQIHIGIYAETGKVAYQRQHLLPREYYDQLGSELYQQRACGAPAVPRPGKRMTMEEKLALIDEYKQLYPKVRQFAFSTLLTTTKQNTLKEYFLVQRRLFGSQLGDYRYGAPEFYSWMIRQVASKTSFLDLLQTRQVKLTDARDYLAMAADDEEKQLLLGLNDEEFAYWQRCGNNALRRILCGRKLKVSPLSFAENDSPALIAARSYDPHSAAKRKPHEKRLEEVRQIARDIREEYDLQLPVDPDALAEKLGIQVEHLQLEQDIDGYVQLDCCCEVITINDSAKDGFARRRRFTLAHEIGHVVIPWHTGTTQCNTDDPTVMVDQKQRVDSQEKEANEFASELLIPSDWLRERMARAKRLDSLLNNVQKQTNTSVLACLYALERILPEGHVICVTSPAMNGWKIFRGPGVPAWKTEKAAFAALDKDYPKPQEFTKGTYQIRYYQKQDDSVHA